MSGCNSLHFAVMCPGINRSEIKKLQEQGFSVEELDEEGNTPLHLAVLNPDCRLEVLDQLLKYDIDIEKYNGDWNTALHLAVKSNCNVRVIRKLLQYGASVHTINRDADTPLHIAVRQQDSKLEVIKVLLKYGADVNKQNEKHETPLHIVAKKHRCKSDIQESQPMQHRQHVCDLEAMKELLKNGADLQAETRKCAYPLSCAFGRALNHASCNIPCINLLIKYAVLRYYPQNYLRAIHHASFKGRLRKASRSVEDFVRNCVREVEHMKRCKITPELTLFDFVSKGNIERSLRQRDKDIDVAQKVLNILLEGMFPIYHNIILINIGRKPLLRILSQLDIYTISAHSEGENSRTILPYDSVFECANYICQQDLVNLTLAYMHSEHS